MHRTVIGRVINCRCLCRRVTKISRCLVVEVGGARSTANMAKHCVKHWPVTNGQNRIIESFYSTLLL